MSVNSTVSVNTSNITVNSSVLGNQTSVFSNISNILTYINLFTVVVGVVVGCFVVNIVRKLDDNDLRSRFSLLGILVCDVILAFSNLPIIIYELALIDQKGFEHLKCPLNNCNFILGSLFMMPLALSLLCLALDQVIAVFMPLYFRTSQGTRRKVIYGAITYMPVPLFSVMLVYWSLGVTESSNYALNCESVTNTVSELLQYQLVVAVSLAISTPMIYAVVLWKISRQSRVHSENPLESIHNRRLVVSFLFLSASYIFLWIPTLVYFSVCYYSSNGCWEDDSNDMSLAVYLIYTLNYIVDPVTCAVRMEPIKQKILLMFRYR